MRLVEPAAFPQSAAKNKGNAMYAYVGAFTTAKREARGDGVRAHRANPTISGAL